MRQQLILGPPGTGKTTKLLDTVKSEMADGVHPSRIAYVSFTKKAASEAVERAQKQFNCKREDFPFFRTLHSLAYMQLGLTRNEVMGANNYRAIGAALGLVFSDYMEFEEGIVPSAKNGDQVLYVLAMARATMQTLEEQWRSYQQGEVDWWRLKQFADTLNHYKIDTGMLDFPDMLDRFMSDCDPLNIDVAFIDEAQDLSKQQWQMARHAVKNAQRVYIAGDDDQAIYRWSGADVDSFLNLKGERTVLDHSYRLSHAVYDVCQTIAQRISRRFEKYWAPRNEKGEVQFLSGLDDLEWRDGTYLFLARNRYLLKVLEEHVRRSGIPYVIRNRSAVDPHHVQAILNWERLRKGQSITAEQARMVYSFMRVGHGFKRGHKRLPGVEDDAVLTKDDMIQRHGLLRTDEWFEALAAIPPEEREFYQAARRRGEKLTQLPRVHINTIHGVKGGEADHVVIVPDMASRTWLEFQQAPDDEHRVAYVAASRSRQTLSVLASTGTRGYDYPLR